jgi:hypothetical protein
MVDVLDEDRLDVPLGEDEQMVEAVLSDSTHHRFSKGVRAR